MATGSGRVSSEDARAQAAEAVLLLKQHEANLALLDYSDALSEVSLAELYWLADHAVALGLPWNARVATVLPRTRYRVDAFHFFELVFRNAGYDVRLFESRPAAEKWLTSSPPVSTAAPSCAHA